MALQFGLMALAVLASCDGGTSGCLMDLVVFGSCDGAASEQFNRIGILGVNATEGGFGNHGSPVGFTNAAAISIKIGWSVE